MDTNSQLMDLLNSYIQSKQFLNDDYVKSLIDKSIKLGLSWEAIKETFKKFLSLFFQKKSFLNIDLYNMDFRGVFDETKFIDQLVMTSIQMESLNPKNPDLDFSDNFLEDSEENLESDLSNLSLKNSKKSPTKQQTYEEYLTTSMNRLNDKSNLRPIIVDGSDVALSGHPNKQIFSLIRVQKVVEYFEKRHHQIYVIIPQWRKEQILSSSNTHNDQLILGEMEQKNLIHYSPSKRVGGKRMYCDDDTFILNIASIKQGIIVSNDNFKRFLNQKEEFKQIIEERVLMYSFLEDNFIPAEDPLGKNGPNLNNFLRFESQNQQFMKRCPYKKKCTYGSKCKFWHPERATNQPGSVFKTAFQSVLDQSNEQRMRLEIILNQPEDSTIASQLLNIKPIVPSFFQDKIEKDNSQNLLKMMGPSQEKSKPSTYSVFSNYKPECSNQNNSLRLKLKEILGDDGKVDEFLAKYKNESDEEKLLFLANGYSFDF
ncbi:unnamed protein product [Brachionus calyciflorus]|uniref:RNase NYN domain-containing protein n=1 Tax=Brachionus calyciflorus TaxID=104777 RepID=A0A813SMG0_9BILA|nr:unnamed protein product [Brachionus calyciflorus]